MHDPLLLQEIADECRTYLTLHETFAKVEDEEGREEFFQREMVGSLQHLAVITVEATEEALEEEGAGEPGEAP